MFLNKNSYFNNIKYEYSLIFLEIVPLIYFIIILKKPVTVLYFLSLN